MTKHINPSVPLPSAGLRGRHILLASNSPRRRELLGMILPEFGIAEAREVDEIYPDGLPADEVPVYLSRLKASAYSDLLDDDLSLLLITADTVVILDGCILGKPRDRSDAVAMLESLSGKTHTVVTGVTLSSAGGCESFSERTDVHFAPLTRGEIEAYVDSFRPYDKAGAYGIQEWIGAAAISGIEGCFYNVMGLPLHALYSFLRKVGGKNSI